MKSYGSRELITCLINLNYSEELQVGSRHLKYQSPKPVEKGMRPFIIVLQNKNNYDPITQRQYIKQIKKHGFTREQIEKAMWGKR